MPLKQGSSRETVSENVSEMMKHGHPQAQAVAASLKEAGMSNQDEPSPSLQRYPVQGGYTAPPGGERPPLPTTGSGVKPASNKDNVPPDPAAALAVRGGAPSVVTAKQSAGVGKKYGSWD